MKVKALILTLMLITIIGAFYFIPRTSNSTTLVEDNFVSKDRVNPKTQVVKHSITVIPPVEGSQEAIVIQQSSFEINLGKELEAQWENEMYQHLLYLDEEHADKIFADYQRLRNQTEKSLENDLTSGIKQLSDMNGQSGEVDSIYAVEERSSQLEEIKHILGPHYEFLEGARRDFVSNNN